MKLTSFRRSLTVLGLSVAAHFFLPPQVEARRAACIICEPSCNVEPAVECLFHCGFEDRYTAVCGWVPLFCFSQMATICSPLNDM